MKNSFVVGIDGKRVPIRFYVRFRARRRDKRDKLRAVLPYGSHGALVISADMESHTYYFNFFEDRKLEFFTTDRTGNLAISTNRAVKYYKQYKEEKQEEEKDLKILKRMDLTNAIGC